MSDKVIIRTNISIGIDSHIDDHETEYTHEEWQKLSEEEQNEIIDEYYKQELANYSSGGAWIKTENDKEYIGN